MRRLLSRLIPDAFKQEFKVRLGAPHMYWSILNLKRNGLQATHIVDIGAYKGEWTGAVLKIFPDAHYLLLEANPEREQDLQAFVQEHPRAHIAYELALLDSQTGTDKVFHVMETASSALEEHSGQDSKQITLPTKTLDEVAKRHHFETVSLLKLDVQGYELQVLKGAAELLARAEAVLLEVSLLDIHKNVPLMHEVVNFMHDRDFVVYDICSLAARRPLDRALWQTDLLFVKEDSVFRRNKSYR